MFLQIFDILPDFVSPEQESNYVHKAEMRSDTESSRCGGHMASAATKNGFYFFFILEIMLMLHTDIIT